MSTITQADDIIDAIGAYGKVVHTGTDTYLFTDSGQEATAADIIAGAGHWATEALDNMNTPAETVEIAKIILAGSFDHASVLIKYTHPELGAQIQQRITATAARYAWQAPRTTGGASRHHTHTKPKPTKGKTMNTTDQYIENLIQQGTLSPAARTMHPQDALDQYNEANALTIDEEGFLIHPDVVETTIEIDGASRRGWAYVHNRQVSSDKPDLKMLQGCDRLSRDLGARILRF